MVFCHTHLTGNNMYIGTTENQIKVGNRVLLLNLPKNNTGISVFYNEQKFNIPKTGGYPIQVVADIAADGRSNCPVVFSEKNGVLVVFSHTKRHIWITYNKDEPDAFKTLLVRIFMSANHPPIGINDCPFVENLTKIDLSNLNLPEVISEKKHFSKISLSLAGLLSLWLGLSYMNSYFTKDLSRENEQFAELSMNKAREASEVKKLTNQLSTYQAAVKNRPAEMAQTKPELPPVKWVYSEIIRSLNQKVLIKNGSPEI